MYIYIQISNMVMYVWAGLSFCCLSQRSAHEMGFCKAIYGCYHGLYGPYEDSNVVVYDHIIVLVAISSRLQ